MAVGWPGRLLARAASFGMPSQAKSGVPVSGRAEGDCWSTAVLQEIFCELLKLSGTN